MFFKKKVKKSRGIELIDEVAGRFITIIDELDEGVCDCRGEQSMVKTQIEMLNQRNVILEASVIKASGIVSNLRSLLGEK